VAMIIWQLDLQLPVQSVPITTNVLSSNPSQSRYFVREVLTTFIWVMVLNATFNNILVISWRSDLLVEETGVLGENQHIVAFIGIS
jgi:hypothetical protein